MTSIAKRTKDYDMFMEQLIEEVQKHPIIWDKRHIDHAHRRKSYRAWENIADKYGKPVEELKSKWRNIKDTFHRECRKVNCPPIETRDKPIICYYEGQWRYLEKLLFLWDEERHGSGVKSGGETQENEAFLSIDVTEETDNLKHFKFELTDSESTDVENNDEFEGISSGLDLDNVVVEAPKTFNENKNDPIAPEKYNRKRRYQEIDVPTVSNVSFERRSTELDEDLHFAKSLVPYMKRLNPVRKLIVRNEIHSLLLRELLCNRCKSSGPQPSCPCNF